MPTPKIDNVSQDRHSASKTWSFTKIDGEDAYDEATNTIRIKHNDGKIMYTFLASTGLFVEPNYRSHMILHLHNWDLKPESPRSVVPGIGILLQTEQFENWKIKSTSNVAAQSRTTAGTAGEGEEVVIRGKGGEFPSGITIRKDGSLVLRGQGTEIVLADEIFINGMVHREHPETRNNLLKSNPMRPFVLPSFCVFPVPAEIPSGRLFWSLGQIVSSFNEISGFLGSSTTTRAGIPTAGVRH
jgi:hypothetical protein